MLTGQFGLRLGRSFWLSCIALVGFESPRPINPNVRFYLLMKQWLDSILRILTPVVLFVAIVFGVTHGQNRRSTTHSSYLFIWAGDADRKQTDFLAVIDVRPNSKRYGRIVTTLPVGALGTYPHHTEHEMSRGGILFANGFGAGRTFRFDLSQPTRPQLVDSFGAAGEYMHPHSFVRLPNGNVLATFQMKGHDNNEPGALVELDPLGRVLRIADASAPQVEKFIRPYSLAVVPILDRIVTSSADMDEKDKSHVVQVWRLSDFKLLKTIVLPQGPLGTEGVDSSEPRVLADGRTVLVPTFNCGLYRITGLEGQDPAAEFVHSFGGKECALPVVAGRYWVQTVSDARALVSLDVSNPARPVEVSRLVLGEKDYTHWIALEPNGNRIVISGGSGTLQRHILIAKIETRTGKLSLDKAFREEGSDKPGISFERERWPHGANGGAIPHGAVFSVP